jgi:tripartite-type tricarboxylate transporter receptor subunit TctC
LFKAAAYNRYVKLSAARGARIMRKLRNRIEWSIAGLVACLSVSGASAQSYPAKPIRLVIGYVPGGAVDFTARLVGQKLAEIVGQQVIVENRAGAATAIATERVATSPADGYTLLLMPISTANQSALRNNLPYDLERDLTHVSLVSIGAFLLVVHPSLPARSVKELIGLARSKPGTLNYGSAGLGSGNHLAGELFDLMANVKMVHVPYKGSGEAVIAAASGQAPVSFPSVASALPLMAPGKLKALAVTTARRLSSLPSLPTIDESGLPGYDYFAWYGVSAPAGLPQDVLTRLNTALGKILQMPDIKEAFDKQGFEPRATTPQDYAALIHREIERTGKLIRLTGLKAE